MIQDKYHFDKKYKESKESYWGLQPTKRIIEFEKTLKRRSKILDLGCGEGRIALYLSKKGHKVDAMDISETAISKLKGWAKQGKLKINAEVADLENYKIKKSYDVIIALASIHFLSKKKVYNMIKEMKKRTNKGGINFITVFRKGDPAEGHFKMYFFNNGELSKLYSDWEIVKYIEFKKEDKHGKKGRVHYHKNANLIAQKI